MGWSACGGEKPKGEGVNRLKKPMINNTKSVQLDSII